MKRESNIELLRIVAMLLVLFVHANYFSLGWIETNDIQSDLFGSFIKSFAEAACIICVNVFILISGWFGIRPSLKGAISLLFQVFFFNIVICLFIFSIGGAVCLKSVLEVFYFGASYWFVPAYLILYALSPVLNSFIENATPKLYFGVLLSFFTLEFALGWIVDYAYFGGGYSTLSFIGLYLLTGYLRKHPCKMLNLNTSKHFSLYLLFTLIPVGLLLTTNKDLGMCKYSSPFVVLSSLFFFLAFNKMTLQNKIVNYIACSAFSVYLVHLHPLVCKHYKCLMSYMYDYLGGALYVLFVIVFAIVFLIFCAYLDKLRIMVWKWICNAFLNTVLGQIERKIDKIYRSLT